MVGKKFKIVNAYSYTMKKGLFLSVYVDDIKLAGKKQNINPMWKVLNKEVDLGEPTSSLDHVYLGCTQRECQMSKDIVDKYRNMSESRISAKAKGLTQTSPHGLMTWKVMQRNVWSESASWRTKQLNNFVKLQLNALMTINSKKKNGICWRIVKGLLGRPDILLSVNKLARAITKWTRACDTRLARLISYIHHTSEFKQSCRVGNTAPQCRLGLFQDSDFAGDLEDSQSTSGGFLCIFGSQTFVPMSWMCKKQTSVSHSLTASEIISVGAGLRMDGIPALDLWDLVIEVLHSYSNQPKKSKDNVQGNLPHDTPSRKHTKNQVKTPIHYNNLEL